MRVPTVVCDMWRLGGRFADRFAGQYSIWLRAERKARSFKVQLLASAEETLQVDAPCAGLRAGVRPAELAMGRLTASMRKEVRTLDKHQ